MPSNKKPRKPRVPKRIHDIDGNRPVMRLFAQTHGVSYANRIKAQNEVLAIQSSIGDGTADKSVIDRAGYAGALWEALCRYGYGTLDEALAMDFEAYRSAALRRGEQLGKFGLNPKEKDCITIVLFDLIACIKRCPELVFYKIDQDVSRFLLDNNI